MDLYEQGVELFEEHKGYPLFLPQEMVQLAMHLSDYPSVYDVDDIDFEIQRLRPSQIAAAWGLIKAGLISHEFSEFKPGWVFFRRSHHELAKWLKKHERGLSNADSKYGQPTGGSTDEWADYRFGLNGPLLSPEKCWELFKVSSAVLSKAAAKDPNIRRKYPGIRPYVYRCSAVSEIANRKSGDD